MFTDRELQQFIRGEIREQGWKSSWRREQERRRAEESAVFIVKIKPIAVQQKPLPKPKAPAWVKPRRKRPMCPIKDCWKLLYNQNSYGLCREHITHYWALIQQTRFCAKCDGRLLRTNSTGLCAVHAKSFHARRYRGRVRDKRIQLLEAA